MSFSLQDTIIDYKDKQVHRKRKSSLPLIKGATEKNISFLMDLSDAQVSTFAPNALSQRNRSVVLSPNPLDVRANRSKSNVSSIVSSARDAVRGNQNPFTRRAVVKQPSYIKEQIASLTERKDKIVMSENAQELLASATKVRGPESTAFASGNLISSSNAFNQRVIGILKDTNSYRRQQSWRTLGDQIEQANDTILELPTVPA